ncbi:MAG: aminoacyl-tRNA hydrolase [Proteobacteria bacterium]|jgi:PTH1 family peptidyl-tRNA hydrolase|nr:aminoacyl-tRNA hydrolase [Pseudomonadota bacterium]
MSAPLSLIVGVGNPGSQYAQTRHNVGVWFVQRLAEQYGGVFREEKKFFGQTCSITVSDQEVRLLIPSTYMNESGKSVGALVNFFRIPHQRMLVAHDELDLATGIIRIKQGGGLAGHNGLRDISRCLAGSQEYNRLRIGVGHPGMKEAVTGHVLGKASVEDRTIIDECIGQAIEVLPLMVAGQWQRAMNELHTFRADNGEGK